MEYNVKEYDNVTIIMTTLNCMDFALSSLWSVNRYYKIKVIITDGGSTKEEEKKLLNGIKKFKNLSVDYIICENSLTEYARNKASELVDTEFILFMDSDVKIINLKGLSLLLEVMYNTDAVESGVYAIKTIDFEKRFSYVSTKFNSHIEVSAMPCYFALHRTDAFKDVGGFPEEWYYPMPDWFKPESTYNGDFTITKKYNEKGLKAITPIIKDESPVLHWTQSTLWSLPDDIDRPGERWYYDNVKHIRCNPLDDWEIMEKNRKTVV